MSKIPLGFVGAGFMGQVVHIPNFLSVEGVKAVALAEARPRLAKLIADKYAIPKVWRTHRELADDRSVDAVVAITHFDFNPEIAVDLLNAGKHVFIEKPMALCSEAAAQMVEAAEKNGRILMVGYMKRYDTGVEIAKAKIDDWLATGEVGDMTYVRSTNFGGDWICGPVFPSFTDEPIEKVVTDRIPTYPDFIPENMRGEFSHFSNVYTHNVNLIRFLLGRELTVRSAKVGSPMRVVTLDAGRVPVVMECGELNSHEWHEETVVYFRRGYVKVKTPSPLARSVPASLQVYTWKEGAAELSCPVPPWGWAFRREAEVFVNCIREGRQPVSSGADSANDVRLVEDIFRMALSE